MSGTIPNAGGPILDQPPPQKHPPELMDDNLTDKRTRSGRRKSSSGNVNLKRKRSKTETNDCSNSKKKMGGDNEEPISV